MINQLGKLQLLKSKLTKQSIRPINMPTGKSGLIRANLLPNALVISVLVDASVKAIDVYRLLEFNNICILN